MNSAFTLSLEDLPSLLQGFRQAISRTNAEQALVSFVAQHTGEFAEIRASWGDVVAQSGAPVKEIQVFRLAHGGRNVGELRLSVPHEWQALVPVIIEFALLSRLQTAAAGATRRRVGERTLDALLNGQNELFSDQGNLSAVALAMLLELPGRGAAAQAAHAHALDVLAGVGEGYFAERKLRGFCTVRGSQAVWLWSPRNLELESRELFLALTESTGRAVKLGISALHPETEIPLALNEAAQAISSLRAADLAFFTQVDTLSALLRDPALSPLRLQVRAQLAEADPQGRLEELLTAFLTHAGTLEELAIAQRIHVNTLRYRLKAAERAVKGSLNDPATISRLYLALGPS